LFHNNNEHLRRFHSQLPRIRESRKDSGKKTFYGISGGGWCGGWGSIEIPESMTCFLRRFQRDEYGEDEEYELRAHKQKIPSPFCFSLKLNINSVGVSFFQIRNTI
jgi:hypothetical protein